MSQQLNSNPPQNVTVRSQSSKRRRRTGTSLFDLIYNQRTDEALELIETGNYNPNERDGEDNTHLMAACQNELTDVALTLLDTGNSNPSAVNYRKETALMIACEKSLIDVGLDLIQTGESCPECKSIEGETALLLATKTNHPTIDILVKELLNTGKSLPHLKDIDGYSALSNAISRGNIQSAIYILNYDPTTASSVNNEGETPLIIATDVNAFEVALPLLKTGKCHPEYAEDNYNTALINACRNGMEQVALEIINTRKSNQFVRDLSGKTALNYAEESGLDSVVNAIKALGTGDIEININAVGFDSENQENVQIKKHLSENQNNVCFKFQNTYFLTNRNFIETQLSMSQNIKYKCKKAGDNVYDNSDNLITDDFTGDENILFSREYFSMSSLTGLQILVSAEEIKYIISNNISSNMFCLTLINNAEAIISDAYIQGTTGVGADHCQTGKSTDIYSIIRGIPICGQEEIISNETPVISSNTINIQYKTNTLMMPFEDSQTIGELKELFLQKLVNEGLIDNTTNKIVKFIYKGKVYTNDKNAELVGSLPDFAPGQTLAALVSIVPSGGKRKTKKRQRKGLKKRFTKKH